MQYIILVQEALEGAHLCPVSVAVQFQVPVFHTKMAPSSPAVSMQSLLNSTHVTAPAHNVGLFTSDFSNIFIITTREW